VTLSNIVARALRRDPSFRLVAYSSPQTIFADITGLAAMRASRREATPERNALAHARLPRDLIHPKLDFSTSEDDGGAGRRARAKSRAGGKK
jgi:hypothetical protein